MKNKKQKIKYINGQFCDIINECYLETNWQVISIHPIASKEQIGAYVLLEKEENETLFNDIEIPIVKSNDEIKEIPKTYQNFSCVEGRNSIAYGGRPSHAEGYCYNQF